MDGQTYGWIDGGQTDGWKEGWQEGRKDGKDVRMKGRKEGWVGGWMDEYKWPKVPLQGIDCEAQGKSP